MESTRELTEAEINRMRNMCASGPLNYKPEIDDELIALHLAKICNGTNDVVDYTGAPFYAKNGTILDCWLKGPIVYQGVALEQHNDKYMIYKGIVIEEYNGRFIVVSNKDLLKLGMCTVKTLQRGHKGYLSLRRLATLIDRKLDTECVPVGTVKQE